jgi:uncharacterized protein (TIGR02145 family)
MKPIRGIIFVTLISVAACHAQSFNISGIVINGFGNGIGNVIVRLCKADLSTITGPDGKFSLIGTITGVKRPTSPFTSGNDYPFTLRNNTLHFRKTEQDEIKVKIFDCNGRLLFTQFLVTSVKECSIALPQFANGIQLYCVFMNHTGYSFKKISGMVTEIKPLSTLNKTPVINASVTVQTDDALTFTKEGYQLSRLAITNSVASDIQVTMVPFETGTVKDIDGNVYKTERYGNQIWTVENLRTTKYNDGESIRLVSDSATWGGLETPAYCFFDYTTDIAEQRKWGAFYNWYAVNTGRLAPTGWHVSTDEDWDTLQNYLISNGYNYDGITSENKIAKSLAVKTDWLASTDSGAIGNDSIKNNVSGFSGLPNGYCDYDGYTYYRNWYAFWWTATQQDSSFVKVRSISYTSSDLKCTAFTKVYGLSVRLVQDN